VRNQDPFEGRPAVRELSDLPSWERRLAQEEWENAGKDPAAFKDHWKDVVVERRRQREYWRLFNRIGADNRVSASRGDLVIRGAPRRRRYATRVTETPGDEYPWPRAEDEMFSPDPEWWSNAPIEHDERGRWILFVQGYKLAAHLLVDAIERHRDNQFVIYPIIFLYRHHVELAMKMTIRYGTRLLDGVETAPPRSHGLKKLWRQCRVVIRRYAREAGEPPPRDEFSAVERCLDQIVAVDPESYTARYPEEPLPENLTNVGLRNLRDAVARVSAFFDAVTTQFSVDFDRKMEMEAEYRQMYGDYDTDEYR
jgi:hypothetical protein